MSILLVFLLSLSAALPSRQALRANFKAVVVDAYVARIPNASVVIEGPGGKRELKTDSDGETVGEIKVKLPPGTYRITIEARGFKRLVVPDVSLASGADVTRQFQLEVRDCDDCKVIGP